MNIYNCQDINDFWCFSVAEETSGKAKAYFASEQGIDFVDVRCSIVKKGVSNKYRGFLTPDEWMNLELNT